MSKNRELIRAQNEARAVSGPHASRAAKAAKEEKQRQKNCVSLSKATDAIYGGRR